MPRECAHATCQNVQIKGNGITFHSFPCGTKNAERRKRWSDLMRRPEGWLPKPWEVVCSEHFRPEDFDLTGQTKRLRDGVVPSKFDLHGHRKKNERKQQTGASKKALQRLKDEVVDLEETDHLSASDGDHLDSKMQFSSIPDKRKKKPPADRDKRSATSEMPFCTALNCSNRLKKGCGKTFHRFPKNNPALMKQWLVNMERESWQPSQYSTVCSDHFEEDCFDRTGQTTRLHPSAVPTLFSFPDDPLEELLDTQDDDSLVCVASGCKKREGDPGVTFHSFPLHDPERLKQWEENVSHINWIPTEFSRLCSEHFTPRSFIGVGQKARLRSNAVPTIFLFEEGIERESEEQNFESDMPMKKVSRKSRTSLNSKPSILRKGGGMQGKRSRSSSSVDKNSMDSNGSYDSDGDTPQVKPKKAKHSHVVSIQEVKKTLASSLESIKEKLSPGIMTANIKKDDPEQNMVIKEEPIDDVEVPPASDLRIREQDKVIQLPNNFIHFKFSTPRREVVLKLNPKAPEMTEIKSNSLEDLTSSLEERKLLTRDAQDLINSLGALPMGLQRIIDKSRKGRSNALNFNEEVNRFATVLFICSPKAYDVVCTIFRLPDKSSIRTRLQIKGYGPGFSQEALTIVRDRISSQPSRNSCSIMFDLVPIKREYNFDKFPGKRIGQVDFTFSKEPYNYDGVQLATDVLLFTAVSLEEEWKIPFGYFFVKELSGELLKNLVQEAILILEQQCSLDVEAIVCNGFSSSIKMGKLFGCNLHARTFTEVVPSFPHPFDEKRKMYLIFGYSQSMKLLINLLKDNGCLRSSLYGVSDWKYFKQLFGDSKKTTPKVVPIQGLDHARFYHLQQLLQNCAPGFSNTLSSALELADELELEEFCGCEGTMCFVADIHRAFDLLNSRKQLSSEDRPPIQLKTLQEQVESLIDVAERLFNLEMLTGERIVKGPRWMSVVLFSFSLKSVSHLAAHMVTNKKLEYFSTYRVNLDHLDMVLSSFKRCGNWSDVPSSSEFQHSYESILKRYSKNTYRNYDFEGEDLTVTQGQIYSSSNCLPVNVDIGDKADNVSLQHIVEDTDEMRTAKTVIKCLSKLLSCTQCIAMMYEEDFSSNFKVKKVSMSLIRPSRFVLRLLQVTNQLIRPKLRYSVKHLEIEHLVSNICLEFTERNNTNFPDTAAGHIIDDPYHFICLMKKIVRSYINLKVFYK